MSDEPGFFVKMLAKVLVLGAYVMLRGPAMNAWHDFRRPPVKKISLSAAWRDPWATAIGQAYTQTLAGDRTSLNSLPDGSATTFLSMAVASEATATPPDDLLQTMGTQQRARYSAARAWLAVIVLFEMTDESIRRAAFEGCVAEMKALSAKTSGTPAAFKAFVSGSAQLRKAGCESASFSALKTATKWILQDDFETDSLKLAFSLALGQATTQGHIQACLERW